MATHNLAPTENQRMKGKERTANVKDRTEKEKGGVTKEKEQMFVWTDDEVELLLEVTHKYKGEESR